jgi:hypothetical protein
MMLRLFHVPLAALAALVGCASAADFPVEVPARP